MAVIHVEAQLSTEQLLKAVAQMSEAEFKRFIQQATERCSKSKARRLSRRESELLLKISQGIPAQLQRRYDQLIAKRRHDTLTDEEYQELLKLSDAVEKLDVKRVEYLTELARIRKISLASLMDKLEIHPPPYDSIPRLD